MKRFMIFLAVALLASPAWPVLVQGEAHMDAVSCCGYGSGTTTIARYVFQYSNVAASQIGKQIDWTFLQKLKCGDPGGNEKLHWATGEPMREHGNQSDGTFTSQETCPFGARSKLTVETLGASVVWDSPNCAQPCEGACGGGGEDPGGIPLPPPGF